MNWDYRDRSCCLGLWKTIGGGGRRFTQTRCFIIVNAWTGLTMDMASVMPFSIVMVMNDKMMDANRGDVGEEVC